MILDEIVANKRAEVTAQRQVVSLVEMRKRAEAALLPRDLNRVLVQDCVAVISEFKRASPSRGTLKRAADPRDQAREYVDSGAAAISVLTDARYFGGTLADLQAVRATVHVPVLRKDFVIDEYQVYESRANDADAILLIVRTLSDSQLRNFLDLSRGLGMHALVEVHDERELERALAQDALIIGINNRNLVNFAVDLGTTDRLAPRVTRGRTIVAESGVSTRSDVDRVARAGVHAVLVGEALMRASDVGARMRQLSTVKRKA